MRTPVVKRIDIIEDPVKESTQPRGTMRLEAQFEDIPESELSDWLAVQQWIMACRAVLMTMDYNGAKLIGLGLEHPHNPWRQQFSTVVNSYMLPLYQTDFQIEPHADSLFLFEITLEYRSVDNTQNALDERKPPDRLNWEDRFNSYYDPNDGRPHLNTAGDWIKDIEETRNWLAFKYTWKSASPPLWLHEYGNNIVNTDTVVLDGQTFKPETLCTSRPNCKVVQGGTGWIRENELWVLYHPFGWRRRFPNVGTRERKLIEEVLGSRSTLPTNRDQYEKIQEQYDRRAEVLKFFRDNGKAPRELSRIATTYNGDEYVREEMPLDKYGMAFRDWELTEGEPNWPLLDPIEPQDLIVLEFRTKLFLPFRPMGLW